jgi:branched-subunit amino acid transport protein
MIWLVMVAVGIATFAMRVSFLVLLERITFPTRLRQALQFVPVAALTALIVSEILLQQEQVAVGLDNPRLLAGVLAAGVAWYTRSVPLTLLVGMTVLWVAQALLA